MQDRLEKLSRALGRFEVKLFIGLLLVLAVGLLYQGPFVAAHREAQRYRAAARENAAAVQQLTTTQSRLQTQLANAEVKRILKNAAKALPANIRFDTEVLRLDPFFRSSGLSDQTLTPGSIVVAPPIAGFNVSITASGNPEELIAFLRLLQKQVRVKGQNIHASGPLWVVKSITVGGQSSQNAPGTGGATNTIQAVILFKPPLAATK